MSDCADTDEVWSEDTINELTFKHTKPMPPVGKLEKGASYSLEVSDPKCDFTITPEPVCLDETIIDYRELALARVETTPISSVDYGFDLKPNKGDLGLKPDLDIPSDSSYSSGSKVNPKQKETSYLSVSSIEEGENWYRKNFPQMPDELIPLCARWNWGDLNSHTKKSVKQEIKNKNRKRAKGKVSISHKPYVVKFD